jgi:biopolymer transport protein ExbB
MFEIVRRGGVLMWPIILCSIVALAIIIERLVQVRRAGKLTRAFLAKVEQALVSGQSAEVEKLSNSSEGPMASVFRAGLGAASLGEERVKEALNEAGQREIAGLEKYMGGLATIVGGAPLLGFLGTVLGMIQAFQRIEQLGGNVNASVLAGGIWQALITTAAGLSVAIPTFFVHNYILARIRSVVLQMEENSNRLIRALREKR